MGILDSLLSDGSQQQDYQGFLHRYEQGQPQEGYSDQEVLNRYGQVTQQLAPSSYMQAAESAFSRIPPQQRAELGQYVTQQAQQRGIPMPNMFGGGGANYEDPGTLAQLATHLHQQQPGLLSRILSGGTSDASGTSGGGILASPAAKAALAGIAAMAVKQVMQRH